MRRIALASLLLLVACATGPVTPPASGTLFTADVVYAGASQTPVRNAAVYVENGRIVDVGSAAELRSRHSGAKEIAHTGATILPGLIDAHGHLYGLGLALRNVDLVGADSYAEVIRRVAERASRTAPGQWVLGRGWDQNEWPVKEFPTAAELDAAVPDHPVVLRRVDGHALLTNSRAMALAGITASSADPAGGRILRDASGRPTGVFIDEAMNVVEAIVPQPSREEKKALVLAAARAIAAEGLTGMHDAGADQETIDVVRELIDEGQFPIRVNVMLADSEPLLASWFARGPLVDHGGRLTVRSVKMYADGALGSRGACLIDPYSDDVHNRGLVITTRDRLADVARKAAAAGFQVNTHAIGDQAVRNVIDAYRDAGVGADRRFRVEHLQVIAPADIPRVVESGYIASVQPTHATSDMNWAEQRLGPQRIRGAYAWRSVVDAGGRLALGSDFPVEQVNPFFGLYSAVTRQDHDGQPPEGWYPEQRLTFAEALRGFTLDAAWAGYDESSRGTIEPGKLADFTIVEGDLSTAPAATLHRTRVVKTVVGGETVWSRSAQ